MRFELIERHEDGLVQFEVKIVYDPVQPSDTEPSRLAAETMLSILEKNYYAHTGPASK